MLSAQTFDPVSLAIFQKQIDHITLQMGKALVRTARSTIFSESHDFSCFLGTADGEILAQADGIPIHTGAGGFAMRALVAKYGDAMTDGDVFLSSDPYVAGGNHLPDWTMMCPVFLDGVRLGFACTRAHQSDIGGGAAGTYNAQATEVFHEGIRLPIMRYAESGKVRADFHEMLLTNSRCPDLLDGDLGAMYGSTLKGAERLKELLTDIDPSQRLQAMASVLDYAELRMRKAIAALPDGQWVGVDGSDTDCFTEMEVPIKVTITKRGDEITVDFTGSAPQIKGFKNSSIANTTSSVYVAIATCFDATIPRNGGTYRPVKIIAPWGSVVNPKPPAALTMSTTFPAIDIVLACWRAFGQISPLMSFAGWGKSVYGSSCGTGPDGNIFVLYHWHAHCGGGAVNGRDGFSQIAHLATLGGLTLPNAETYERLYPCRILKQELRKDAAGAGKFRGGPSVDYECEVFVPQEHSMRNEGGRRASGFGVMGGQDGLKGSIRIYEKGSTDPLPSPPYATQHFGPAHFVIEGTAGGGWGNPKERDPQAVLNDVLDEIVSPECARSVYGVALTPGMHSVDVPETARLRA